VKEKGSVTRGGAGVKERPILFSGPMVCAILEGRKTQTRRAINPQPRVGHVISPDWGTSPDGHQFGEPGLWLENGPDYPDGAEDERRCPYGMPGDRLWVRETWRSWEERCDDGTGGEHGYDTPCGPHCQQTYVAYRATPRQGFRPRPDRAAITFLDESTPLHRYHESLIGPWRPSIFMPRAFSRLTLEITTVRVQRVQDIGQGDACAEGCPSGIEPTGWFSRLWDGVRSGERLKRGEGWNANPWVWAITFQAVPA
jgi:hypothetical protein